MWNSGGFMDANADGGANFNSPSQFSSPDASKQQGRRSQSIVPLTVKTIQEADGDNVMVAGNEVRMVVIVGFIKAVDMSSTKITYTIDDSTGTIEGIKWLEGDENEQLRPLMEMTYCHIVGSVRVQLGKKMILIMKISPIMDLNRLTTHILEVIHTPLKLQELDNKAANILGAIPSGSEAMPTDRHQPQLNNPNFGGSGGSLGITGSNKLVYDVIKMCMSESGIHKSDIFHVLKGKASFSAVEKALDELSGEGHIFSTIDDEHYKCADSF